MADHPEDTAIIAERDAARAQAANAEREAGAAEAAGDRPRAIQLYHQARDLTRTAEQADRRLRANEDRRRAVAAHTLAQHQLAGHTDMTPTL
jgi:hypothetical protein